MHVTQPILRLALLCLCFVLPWFAGVAQKKVLNIPAIHQLVDQSESEHKLQVEARNKQAVATANERVNLTSLERLKNRYRQLQQRYNTLGLLVDAAGIGITARPMVSRIIANQQEIIVLIRRHPVLAAMGFESELLFASRASRLLTYVTALALAVGDINQMRASDRKLLFDFVLSELSNLQDLSNNLLSVMQYAGAAGMLRTANPFQHYVDEDIALGKEIIENAKFLK